MFCSLILIRHLIFQDTGVAVRKRIIRILRDVIDRQPDFERNPESVAKIVRRIADEDGVRKLVLETLFGLWFSNTRDAEAMRRRITLMVDSINEIIKLGYVEYLKQAISAILKEYAERSHMEDVCRHIVDALVENILQLDQEMANAETVPMETEDNELNEVANQKRVAQQRQIASLTALSVFSTVKPTLLIRHTEVLLPYLAVKPTCQTESHVLVAIVQMLERIVPLMDHPSDSFLRNLDTRIEELLQSQNVASTINACVACSGSIYRAFPKFCPKLFSKFAKFLGLFSFKTYIIEFTSRIFANG